MSVSLKVGDTARVKSGPHEGVVGVLFWKGQSRRDEQRSRFGLRDTEGEVYWIDDHVLERGELKMEPVAFDFGDRVLAVDGRSRGKAGQVFWMGANKYRPGTRRYGVRDDDGDSWFADSNELQAA